MLKDAFTKGDDTIVRFCNRTVIQAMLKDASVRGATLNQRSLM